MTDINPPSRVLVIKWSALGDVAIASAAIEDIRRAWPDAVLHLNTLPAAARMFADDPRFDELVVVDVRARRQRLRNHLAWLRRIRRGRYDVVVDLQGSDHTRLLLAALLLSGHRIPRRLGVRGGFPYNATPALRERSAHAFMQMRSALQAGGIPAEQVAPVLHAGACDRTQVTELLAREGLASGRFALLLPGSQAGGWLKRWGAARYAELALAMLARGDVDRVAVLGGPEEVEECQAIVARVEAMRPGTALHLDRVPLLQIPLIATGARWIVSNDTGTAHVAAVAGRPMLVLCGPTDPRRVKPMGPGIRAVQAQQECLSCYRKTCLYGDTPACLDAISPQSVMTLLEDPAAQIQGLSVIDDASVAGA